MLSMIVDYLFLLIAKILIVAFFIGLGALVVFLAYWGFIDYATAIRKIQSILMGDVMMFFSLLLLVGCMFHTPDTKSISSRKKFNTNKYLDRVFFEHDSGNRMF